MLDIVIPVQYESSLLETCVASIEETTTDYKLHVFKDSGLNVGEARQAAMDTLNLGKYVCFLDDDSVLQVQGWAEKLMLALDQNKQAVVAFGEEDWEGEGYCMDYHHIREVRFGPAACMMIDTTKIPDGFKWDPYIGLRSGWLGGDFEEVDYVYRLKELGLHSIGVPGTRFLHTDRPSLEDFRKTDRAKTCTIMHALIRCRLLDPERPDFFRKLEYVKANPNNDRMLAPGQTLKKCFNGVILDNHMESFPMFKKQGLV